MLMRNHVPKLRKGFGLWPIVVALLLCMSLQAQAASYDYTAITKNKSANALGPVQAGSLTWQCSGGNTCRISGPWPVPGLGACRALAKMIGPIDSYGHPKKYLTSDQIDQCNKGIASDKRRAPIVGEIVAPTAGVSSKPPDASKDTSAPVSSLGRIAATSERVKETIVTPMAANLPAVQIPLGERGISRAELREVAETINVAGSRRYNLVVFQRRGVAQKGTGLKVLRSENVDGLLMNRDRSAMRRLDWGLYDDRMNNLVLISFLADEAGNKVPYSLTATSWGENIFTADRDNDGVVDSAFGATRGDGRQWMMSHGNFKRLMECMEEAGMARGGSDMFAAASLCVPCLDPGADPGAALTAEESGCVNRRESESGGGPLGGLFNSDAMQGILGAPECGPVRPGSSMAWGPGKLPPEYLRTGRDSDRDLDEAIDEDLIESARNDRFLAEHARQTAREFYRDGETEAGNVFRTLARAREDSAAAKLRMVGTHGAARGRLAATVESYRVLVNGIMGIIHRNPEYHSGGDSMESPAIRGDGMPEPGIEDPRCTGNATSVAQGSIWGNQCRNPDGSHIGITECVRRMTDSTYAITGGKCWQEPGPAGGTIRVCEGDRRSRSSGSGSGDDPSGGTSPGGDASDTTDGGRTSVGGGAARGTGGSYIDVTPLGALLIARCAGGYCPDPIPMDIRE